VICLLFNCLKSNSKSCYAITENITEIVTYDILQATQYVLEYLLRFLARLHPLPEETLITLLKRLVASLTQQGVPIHGILQPSGTHCKNHEHSFTMSSYRDLIIHIFNICKYQFVYSLVDSHSQQGALSHSSRYKFQNFIGDTILK
jgi:hypothetical protein